MTKLSIQNTRLPDQVPQGGWRFSAWLGRCMLNLLGWRFEGQFPNHSKMVIAVAPHTSNWDFFIGLFTMMALRLKLNFLGKHSIFIWPIRGFLTRIGGIPVQRSTKHGLVEQLSEQFAARSKMVLALAPEGTRSKVEEWKSGFLQIAHRADVPLFLVGLDFAKKAVIFGPSLAVSGDLDAEMRRVRDYFSKIQGKFPHLQ